MSDLYFDDDSQDFAEAALITGINAIAPGESGIAIDDATDEFTSVWSSVYYLYGVQIATFGDSRLSGGGGGGVTLLMSVWRSY